ncbi:hypothetical protein SUGI_0383930 [Cryptomeria japonica]|uniref:acidic endochitinase-like n=1 Tax=Cryptomeria japonica TaxID=3369 RepID=UPI002408AA72|nr:acidic endochitinase-like [Cryptomeria japonica]GLJ21008.1 hypothetical protein SUGI_0383930 [Cryptomeria japonica]
MESRRMSVRVRGAMIACVVALLWSGASVANISIYWDQNRWERSLADTCASGRFEIVMLDYLSDFGNGQMLVLNLADHCYPPSGGCKPLSADIESYQSNDVKVFLSIGGWPDFSNNSLSFTEDAQNLTNYLWENFLGGQSDSRPLGDAVLDDIDFDIRRMM